MDADPGRLLHAPLAATGGLPRRIVRAPALKRSARSEVPLADRIRLERVLGVTVGSNAAVDCSPSTGLVAYPAGCTVVLFNPRRNRQAHILNTSKKSITSLRFSSDGQYLVTGECGRQPAVRVWDVEQRTLLQEFLVHNYGITCVGFSPGNKYVVSVGFQHDMIVNVWDWQRNVKVASNKVSSRVKAVSFAENGSYFVTVGNRHVKFWYLELSRSSKLKEAVPLTGRSAILGEQRNNYFCDVSCGRGDMGDSTFAITRSGLLCEFNNRRLLDKWVELRTDSAYCMTAGEQLIFIGCSDGIVRCFSPVTLQFVTTLPRTHYLGVDVARGLNISHMASHPAGSRYPDCVGVSFDESSNKVTCFYNDHSVYVWDVRDIRKVGKSLSFLYHSACIWGVETYPSSQQPSSMADNMPAGTFITCSSDDTVRLWNLEPAMPDDSAYKRNIYSNDLLKILYIDPSLQYIKDVDQGSRETNGADKSDPSYDCKNGVRCIKISPDGRLLASGDRQGNVRVHDLHSLEEQCKIEAHDAEVLCLEYSRPDTGYQLLASASRDRLIHLFSVDQDCRFVQTLDDHSSSITAVRFFQHQERAFMVSCGADKSVIFREAVPSGSGELQFALSHNVVGKTTLYDIEVDHSQRHILTACQDRNIRVYNVANGKHSKTFRGSVGDDGTLIKLALDQSGIYVATSCTDKTLSVYDYYSGECMATMFGHSELVTGIRFTNDCRHLISVSGDGCVFVWRVPHDMQQTMCARLQQQARRGRRRQTQSVPPIVPPTVGRGGVRLDGGRHSAVPLSSAFSPDPSADPGYDSNANERDLSDTDYKFSIGKLPQWAKKKVKEQAMSPTNERPIDFPKGRWAQRVDTGGLTVKSIYDTDSVIPFPVHDSLRSGSVPDSEGSKDSSLEETRRISDKSPTLRYRQPVEARNRHIHDDSSDIGSYRLDEGTTDHDGDIDDYSEPESTENDVSEAPMYYPTPISDETAGAQYTVNAMDQEELRRSVRRYRRPRPARLLLAPTASTTGSAAPSVGSPAHDESDEDFIIDEEEDEVSTPSAETDGGGGGKKMGNTLSTSLIKKNALDAPKAGISLKINEYLLSKNTPSSNISMESLDQATRQERFLTKNFESLNDGPSLPATPISETPNGKASISSQFHGRAVQLGLARSQESLRKREELQRRIQETRRKLQHIGYKPTMRGSQSVCDLSSSAPAVTIAVTSPQGSTTVGGASRRARAVSGELTDSGVVVGAGGSAAVDYGGPDAGSPVDHGGLRRAISLSDLTDANAPRRVLPAPPVVSGRKPASSRKSRSSMARSSSMNSLNHGMPECGSASTVVSGRVSRAGGGGGGAMRPTIASMNKQRSPLTGGVNQPHRRPLSGSASVSDVRIPDPDSSSEDPLSPIEWRSPAYSARNGTVATNNGRLRSGSLSGPSFDPGHHGRDPVTSSVSGGGTARSIASGVTVTKTRQQTVTKRQTVTLQGFDVRGSSPETDWDILDVDVNTLPLTREVCEAMTAALQRSSENVLLLQRRLMSADCSVPDEAAELCRLLGGGVTQALSTLRALQVPPAALKLPPAGVPLDPQASASNPAVLQMMQQYSDALITMMQQRIQQPNSNPPG